MDLTRTLSPANYHYYFKDGRPIFARFLLSVDSICLSFIFFSGVSHLLFGVPDVTRIPRGAGTVIGAMLVGSATNRLIFFLRLLIHRMRAAEFDARYAVRFMTAMFLSNIVSTTAFTVIFLYYFGVIQFMTRVFAAYWPFLSSKASYAISTILGWIVSGVVGNYATHLLGKVFRKKRRR